jgi:hypothetical protein
MGMVTSVQEGTELLQQKMEFHSESWIGAINLDEEHVKILWSLFKCPQCRTNTHTFPSCPLLKHWYIEKKARTDIPPDLNTTGAVCSAYAIPDSDSDPVSNSVADILDPIEESLEEDFDSNVEFDLLSDDVDNHNVNSNSGNVYPYSEFKVPLGSVRSAYSSICGITYDSSASFAFNVIIDSGCTKHMFTDKSLFQSYKPCSHSFVTLADKSRTACHGVGTVCLSLGGKTIILHDVLYVPSL